MSTRVISEWHDFGKETDTNSKFEKLSISPWLAPYPRFLFHAIQVHRLHFVHVRQLFAVRVLYFDHVVHDLPLQFFQLRVKLAHRVDLESQEIERNEHLVCEHHFRVRGLFSRPLHVPQAYAAVLGTRNQRRAVVRQSYLTQTKETEPPSPVLKRPNVVSGVTEALADHALPGESRGSLVSLC